MRKPFSLSDKSQYILVVDDMSLSRITGQRLLGELGFANVTLADNGQAAWDAMESARGQNKPFSLVLCDWMMPQLDGLGLLGKIKAAGWPDEPHFLLVTAESDMGNIVTAIKTGISGYILKPLTADALKEALENLQKK